MTYFVVRGSEDGTEVETCENEEELKEYLKDSGLTNFKKQMATGTHYDTDPAYWPEDTCLIIKGEVLTPKERKVVMEWEF